MGQGAEGQDTRREEDGEEDPTGWGEKGEGRGKSYLVRASQGLLLPSGRN